MSALIQGTHEWLELRKTMIGASDAPILMGESPWKTPFDLWQEKMGIVINDYKSPAMDRGINLEPTARECYEMIKGIKVYPTVVFHPDYEFMMASMDGLSLDGQIAVEIKCPGYEDHNLAIQGIVPKKYRAQLQHQLAVTGCRMIDYFSFDGSDGVIVNVLRDDDYIESMISKEKEFYNHMINFTPPPLTERDYVTMDNDIWTETATRYMEIKDKLQDLEKEEKDLKDILVSLAGRSNAKGAGIKLSKVVRKGYVDYQCIPELRGVNLDAYRKGTVESWRVTLY